jgi:HSP20 family protein
MRQSWRAPRSVRGISPALIEIKGIKMFYTLASRTAQPARSYPAANSDRTLEKFLSETARAVAGAATTAPHASAAKFDDSEKTYTLQLDVPGLSREQIEVTIEADVVRVASKPDASRSVKGAWRFPLEIDVAATTAKLENGVLTLTLGKKLPVNDVKTIEVH